MLDFRLVVKVDLGKESYATTWIFFFWYIEEQELLRNPSEILSYLVKGIAGTLFKFIDITGT